MAAGLAILFALNLVNPEAVVVRHKVDYAADTGRFDPGYLVGLSDDALPALVDALPKLDPSARREVFGLVCANAGHASDDGGWLSTNFARDAANEARSHGCAANF